MQELNAKNFKQATGTAELAVVDFWAEWCGPCKMLLPVLEELSGEVKGKATIYKMNIEEKNPENREIAKGFEVKGIPTMIFFKNGKEIDRAVGFKPLEELLELVEKHK